MSHITGKLESLHLSGQILDIPTKDVLKYLGLRGSAPDDTLLELVESCLAEFKSYTRFAASFLLQPCIETADGMDFGVFFAPGQGLKKHLQDCDRAILFVATAGLESERQRRRMEVLSMGQAVVLDAIGSAAIEWFCDFLCDKWQEEYEDYYLKPRFSPGYSDLPLSVQKDLLNILDAGRRTGVTLTDSLLMLPQKSVSAFVGLTKVPDKKEKSSCKQCNIPDCQFRL